MAFEEKDTTAPVSVTRDEGVEEITFRRNRNLDAPGLEILVTWRVDMDGRGQKITKRVPQATVEVGWPGAARTLRAHLGLIIDNATE